MKPFDFESSVRRHMKKSPFGSKIEVISPQLIAFDRGLYKIRCWCDQHYGFIDARVFANSGPPNGLYVVDILRFGTSAQGDTSGLWAGQCDDLDFGVAFMMQKISEALCKLDGDEGLWDRVEEFTSARLKRNEKGLP